MDSEKFFRKSFPSFPSPLWLLRRHSELSVMGSKPCRKLPEMTFLGFWELGKIPSVTRTHVLFHSESSESSQLNSIFCNWSKENSETFWCYEKLFRVSLYFFRVSKNSESSEILNNVSFLMVINELGKIFPNKFFRVFFTPPLTVVASALGTRNSRKSRKGGGVNPSEKRTV